MNSDEGAVYPSSQESADKFERFLVRAEDQKPTLLRFSPSVLLNCLFRNSRKFENHPLSECMEFTRIHFALQCGISQMHAACSFPFENTPTWMFSTFCIDSPNRTGALHCCQKTCGRIGGHFHLGISNSKEFLIWLFYFVQKCLI